MAKQVDDWKPIFDTESSDTICVRYHLRRYHIHLNELEEKLAKLFCQADIEKLLELPSNAGREALSVDIGVRIEYSRARGNLRFTFSKNLEKSDIETYLHWKKRENVWCIDYAGYMRLGGDIINAVATRLESEYFVFTDMDKKEILSQPSVDILDSPEVGLHFTVPIKGISEEEFRAHFNKPKHRQKKATGGESTTPTQS